MLRRPRIARFDRAAVAKRLTAGLLMLALVSAFAPFASLAAALSHAKMPCCEMAAHHAEGGAECVGHSCHTKPPAAKKETKPSDPICGADEATTKKPDAAEHQHAAHKSHHAAPRNRHDADDASSHPSASEDKSQPSAEQASAEQASASSHSHAAPAHSESVAASVSKPCPPDCSTGANSVTNRTPRREHAINATTHAPRLSARRIRARRASRPSDISAEKRRQTRPRAPPSALVS